jgi:hypothetical protein
MQLPRFRIRTLMIAVAVVGFEFWLLRESILGGLVLGPLIGATLAGFHSRYRVDDFDRPLGLVFGSVMGGVGGAVMVTIGVIGSPSITVPAEIPLWFLFCAALLANVVVGLLLGMALGLLDILRATIVGPSVGPLHPHSDILPTTIESALATLFSHDRAEPPDSVGVELRFDDVTIRVDDQER